MSADSPVSGLINRFNSVLKIASAQNEDFPNELCDFLSEQYQLQGVVLFRIEGHNNDLLVLGKSKNAKKSYLEGTKVNCNICKMLTSGENGLNTDAKCELQVSEFLVYESCYKFDLFDGTKAFLKLAKKTPFNQDDLTDLNQVSDLIDHLWKVWKGSGSQSTDSSSPTSSSVPSEFSKIVVSTGNELRGPINTIVGFTSILSEDNLTSSQSENVGTIKQNAHDLLLSVNDLIDLAKLESGNVSVKNKSIDIKSMMEDIVDLFKNKKENESNSIELTFEGEIPGQIEIDDQKLRYILNNILLFSSKLTINGSIKVVVHGKSEGGLEFSISDTGIGVSPDVKVEAFKPFKLSSIDKLRHTTLSALGFTLVKEYIKFFNGVIKFDSVQGQGSTITFSLFKDKVTVLEDNIAKIPQPKPDGDNSVLVIEDDYASQKILKTNLEKWGYTPELVSSPDDVFTFLDKKTYLAIILNIEIPNANGLELVQRIRKHPKCKGTPIIVMSVDTEQQKAFMMGPVEYFVKPINYNFLVETLTSFKLRKNSNVLCVDDDVPTMNLIKQAIETAGFNAIAENVSANVMDLIKDKDIDLAIIDLDMPHPNGFELIKLIKSSAKFANLPIIIYTGKENYQDDLQKIDGLFEELLDKRSTYIEDLSDTINAMINRYETPPPVEEVIQSSDGIKILLAEDYKHSQIIVTRLLKKNDFKDIVIVENGEEALKMAEKDKFDLILMDMQMPVMNGFEATEKIRQIGEYKETPIIALTAFAMKGDREKCLQAGATDYIPKPIDSKEFIEKVKYYTNTPK